MTIRDHLEAIRDDWLFEDCERLNAPHPIWEHAVAAIAQLDRLPVNLRDLLLVELHYDERCEALTDAVLRLIDRPEPTPKDE